MGVIMGIVAVSAPLLWYLYKQPRKESLEEGDIDFLWRLKVESKEMESVKEVQPFSIVLTPKKNKENDDQKSERYRLLVVEKNKSLPKDRKYEATETINRIFKDRKDLKSLPKDRKYEATETINRIFKDRKDLTTVILSDEFRGEGKYTIIKYLTRSEFEYNLEMPKDLGETQRELGIQEKGNYIITMGKDFLSVSKKNLDLLDCPNTPIRLVQKLSWEDVKDVILRR